MSSDPYGGVQRAADLPPIDFWEVLYTRRSVRKFKPDPVPRELVDKLTDAALIAPTSCNLQMWDFVVVDDPEVLAVLGELSIQVLNAPTCIFVSYGRQFSEAAYANVQSASAAIQNMSLAARALDLGSFWITQLGDREKVRELLGIPPDREVYAGLAVGFPAVVPKRAPTRRPKDHVCHYNHYAGRHIPSSPRPADWSLEDVALYHRTRVLNGNRYNKPRPWELEAVLDSASELIEAERAGAWLDFMPFSGILTQSLRIRFKQSVFSVCDLTLETAQFSKKRASREGGLYLWPQAEGIEGAEPLPQGAFATASVLFRLEALPPQHRAEALGAVARALEPGGRLLLGWCNARSYHTLMERLRRGRLGGVEYVLAPEPHYGPFEALTRGAVEALVRGAGLRIVGHTARHVLPAPAEAQFRTRNLRGPLALAGKLAAGLAQLAEILPGARRGLARLQFLCLEKTS